ncbi:MAG: NADH-quinone oxidoreductase subunit L [bacterium]
MSGLIVLFPLAGWLINGLAGGRLPARAAAMIGSASVGLAFVVSVVSILDPRVWQDGITTRLFTWIAAGEFTVEASLLMDPLSALMALLVSGVSFLIHVYSAGYMAGDPAQSRYFAYLNLFVASMLLLVLAGNLVVMFVGWELVGLCSYLLIGFWFERERAANAGRKAFVVNRIGDAGFLLGILLLAVTVNSLDFVNLSASAESIAVPVATAATLLLFVGATGKSAQLPLYVWLPDAMEGPTPVSALIHAATMVTAGVYMIARLQALFFRAEVTLSVIAAVGALTAFFAATVALVEHDLKRVLAYSTISQLGYMFLAMGVAAAPVGMFHLTTHAFFKALLFLAAGSVMHAMHDVIDMRRLGGLARPMRWTALGFLIGAAALAGFPLTSGFFSKDLILERAFAHAEGGLTLLLWIAGVLTAFVTALYITRAAILTFAPPPSHQDHPHEAPPTMTWPMAALAALALGGGILGARAAGAPLLHALEAFFHLEEPGAAVSVPVLALTIVSTTAALLGILAGFGLYRGRRDVSLGALGNLFRRQWFVEDLYEVVIVEPSKRLAHFLAGTVDLQIIDGRVNGVAAGFKRSSAALRRVQTGYVRNYAAVVLAGTVLLLGYWLTR